MAGEIEQLLTEIRDTQREHLAEYRRVAERMTALQEQSVRKQDQIGRLYRVVIIVSVFVVGYFIWRISR